jgi:hypothetical protein
MTKPIRHAPIGNHSFRARCHDAQALSGATEAGPNAAAAARPSATPGEPLHKIAFADSPVMSWSPACGKWEDQHEVNRKTMNHFRYALAARVLFGLGAALSQTVILFAPTSSAEAQVPPRDQGCDALAARCPAGVKSAPCVALRQRCSNTTQGAKPGGTSAGMSQLDHPTDMPHCSEGQELVMVPTCRCASPLETGTPSGDLGTCASCSNDGMRLECQSAQ